MEGAQTLQAAVAPLRSLAGGAAAGPLLLSGGRAAGTSSPAAGGGAPASSERDRECGRASGGGRRLLSGGRAAAPPLSSPTGGGRWPAGSGFERRTRERGRGASGGVTARGERSDGRRAAGLGYDQTAASIELISEKLSQPSDVNNSDAPADSSERSPLESQSRQVRSCTKVIMQGIAVGRAVDLIKLSGYSDLCHKLEEMFDIQGELGSTLKKWRVIYTDDEDDMMLVGDDPWNEFCSMVKRIYIYTYEEAKKLTSKSQLPVSSDTSKLSAVNSSSE